MRGFRNPVDHGDAAVFGELAHLRIAERAQNERGNAVSSQHDRRVFDALAAGKLRFVFGQKHIVPAHLADTHLKGNARSGGYVSEQQADRLVFEDAVDLAHLVFLFHDLRRIQKFKNFFRGNIRKLEKVRIFYPEFGRIFIDVHFQTPLSFFLRRRLLRLMYIHYSRMAQKRQPECEKFSIKRGRKKRARAYLGTINRIGKIICNNCPLRFFL